MGGERLAGAGDEMDLEKFGGCPHNGRKFIRDGYGPTGFGGVGSLAFHKPGTFRMGTIDWASL